MHRRRVARAVQVSYACGHAGRVVAASGAWVAAQRLGECASVGHVRVYPALYTRRFLHTCQLHCTHAPPFFFWLSMCCTPWIESCASAAPVSSPPSTTSTLSLLHGAVVHLRAPWPADRVHMCCITARRPSCHTESVLRVLPTALHRPIPDPGAGNIAPESNLSQAFDPKQSHPRACVGQGRTVTPFSPSVVVPPAVLCPACFPCRSGPHSINPVSPRTASAVPVPPQPALDLNLLPTTPHWA